MKAPCKDCPNRQVGCHSSCKAYQEFSAERESVREARLKQREESEFFRDMSRQKEKATKNYRRKKH